jgi:hypothetical protein
MNFLSYTTTPCDCEAKLRRRRQLYSIQGKNGLYWEEIPLGRGIRRSSARSGSGSSGGVSQGEAGVGRRTSQGLGLEGGMSRRWSGSFEQLVWPRQRRRVVASSGRNSRWLWERSGACAIGSRGIGFDCRGRGGGGGGGGRRMTHLTVTALEVGGSSSRSRGIGRGRSVEGRCRHVWFADATTRDRRGEGSGSHAATHHHHRLCRGSRVLTIEREIRPVVFFVASCTVTGWWGRWGRQCTTTTADSRASGGRRGHLSSLASTALRALHTAAPNALMSAACVCAATTRSAAQSGGGGGQRTRRRRQHSDSCGWQNNCSRRSRRRGSRRSRGGGIGFDNRSRAGSERRGRGTRGSRDRDTERGCELQPLQHRKEAGVIERRAGRQLI